MTKLMFGFLSTVILFPIVAQVDAGTTVEKLGKGTAQMVLAVVVVCLALAIVQIFRYHRRDMLDAKQELKHEMEKSIKLIADNTLAMNMQADSNKQLKEAIYHLSGVISKCRGPKED